MKIAWLLLIRLSWKRRRRSFVQKMKALGCESALVITDELAENLFLASRNLPSALAVEVNKADPVSLIRFPRVVNDEGPRLSLRDSG